MKGCIEEEILKERTEAQEVSQVVNADGIELRKLSRTWEKEKNFKEWNYIYIFEEFGLKKVIDKEYEK